MTKKIFRKCHPETPHWMGWGSCECCPKHCYENGHCTAGKKYSRELVKLDRIKTKQKLKDIEGE
jgi:hypothetical protein